MLYQSNATKVFPKIIGIGKNYIKHVQEMGGVDVPKTPMIFLKPWTTVTYMPKQVHLPAAKIHRVDHELELGVFISKAGSNIKKEDAFSHIGGYFLGIDMSDRGKVHTR
jgi:acylpyruvate hydrolase